MSPYVALAALDTMDYVAERAERGSREKLQPDPLPERKIEFIGNSITAGYDQAHVAMADELEPEIRALMDWQWDFSPGE